VQAPLIASLHCWEIGIVLLPEARGRGYGTQAQRLLARYLFAHTTVHRIWAGTEVDNVLVPVPRRQQVDADQVQAVPGTVSASTSWRRPGVHGDPRRQCRDHGDDGCDQADQGRILRRRELPPGESDTQGQRG
jgi:Acetyltransferase (GNAT) domain